MSIIEEVANHLEFLGFGTVSTAQVDGDIFFGVMPDKPDTCICVFSTDSGYHGSPNGARIQIATRAMNDSDAYDVSQEIIEELVDFIGFLAGDGSYVRIEVVNASQGLGADSVRRYMYSSNIVVYYC